MAKEDIINKDLVNELKDTQADNDQSHLEPVNVILGRFQPMTIGHLGMAKELEKINGLPSVYIYIRSKSGKNSKFTDKLTINYMEDVVKGQDLVKDAWAMSASFIPVIVMETQRRGYNPVLIGAGEDRAKTYTGMAKRMKNITTHPDFSVHELKGRLTSATEVRQSIMDGDIKKFKKLTPKQVHPYYKQLKDELENTAVLAESITIESMIMDYDLDIDTISDILESYGEDLFSDTLIVESILDYEIDLPKELSENVMSDINLISQESKDLDDFKSKMKKDYPKMKEKDVEEIYMEMTSIDEARKPSAETKKFFKGMTKVKLDKKFANAWMPGHNAVFLDTDSGTYYMIDSEGDHMEVKNIETLKQLKMSLNEGRLPKIKFKQDYPTYNATYGGTLDAITNYVEDAGYKIDDQEFFAAFGDAFFKPKKGKTQSKTVDIQDKAGKPVGNLHVSIYNRGVDGNTYELTMYHDQIMRGLKEARENKELSSVILEHVVKINENAILKSHTKVFENALSFRNFEIDASDLSNKAEREVIPFLAKLDETKLSKFKDYLNEMMDSSNYQAKIDSAVAMIVKTNRPVSWEDFKTNMMGSDFFKKEFKPFLMMQGLTDYQIDRFVENLIRVKYQHYTNYFLGNPGLQYIVK